MSHPSDLYIGIDLGGTKIKGCLINRAGEIQKQLETETCDTGDAAWINGVEDLIASLQDQAPLIKGVALSAPGIASEDGRSIAVMPDRMQGLVGLDWTTQLGRAHQVHVLNDAHAFTLGEAWLGAARDCDHAVVLTLGTGVGGGVICNGELLLGAQRRAGHLGHISLDPEGLLDCTRLPGSLEDAFGELTLPQRSAGRFNTTVELLAAMQNNDAEAAPIWATSVRALAAAIASFINLFDPQVVVLGGGIAAAGDQLLIPLNARLDEIEWRFDESHVPIVLAELGRWAGAVGAVQYAIKQEV